MAKTNNNTKQKIYVAIDVAKHKFDALIEFPNGSTKALIVKQNQPEFDSFFEKISKENHETIIGFEATGYYHRAIAYQLVSKGFTVKLVSSIATARMRESKYNSLDKNDKRDTKVILYLLKSGITQVYHDPLIHNLIDIRPPAK